MAAKRRASADLDANISDDANLVEITPLGAGQEVGRSCIIFKYMGKTIMFDCGIHPGHSGLASLPFLDEVDLSTVDVALITHFHLDHCAAVPYLVGRTNFKGRLLMTHPTKAIFHTLLKDFVRVSKGSTDEQLYGEKDLEAAMARTEVIDFHQTLEMDGIKVTPYRAGHVLGAAMFLVEVAGVRCLYTGDYSRLADRHLSSADTPHEKCDIVIVESTYGVSRHPPREDRERRFLQKIHDTVAAGGRVLLPVVALGRAQELLLMLEEYWERHPELQHVPIYQASSLGRRAITIFQTYVEMMNDDIKKAFQFRNPFSFKHVQHLKNIAQFDDSGPCVMMATPSMLQSGVSRELFEAWCEDERNTVIICDFAVQGTLARELLGNPSHVMMRSGVRVPLRMAIDAVSFSAHADFEQTSGFLDEVRPPHVVLVHGEAGEMMRLKQALERRAAALDLPRNVYTPKDVQPVQIEFHPEHVAKVMGRLSEKQPRSGDHLRGVLVRKAYTDTLLHPEDLPTYTKLYTGRVLHKQAIALEKPFSNVRLALEVMFEGVEGAGQVPVTGTGSGAATAATAGASDGAAGESTSDSLSVGGIVTVRHRPADRKLGYSSHVVVEWEGGAVGDMVADAVVAVVLQATGEPPGAALAEEARRQALAAGDVDAVAAAELQLLAALLGSQFGPAVVDAAKQLITVDVDGEVVSVDYRTSKVASDNENLRRRVETAVLRVSEAMRPCPLDFDD